MNADNQGSNTMRRLILELPDQLRTVAGGLDRLDVGSPPHVVLAGMGGSAIAGDLARPLLAGTGLHVHRDYGLPAWVGAGDLVVAASYSGDTEETLSAWEEAARRGCTLLAITSGGDLADRAARRHVPVLTLPGGLPPRAALGHALGTLVRALGRLGALAGEAETEIAAAADLLADRGEALFTAAADAPDGWPHPAAVAEDLRNRLPVIHSAGTAAHGAARRLAAQLNENAKVPALLAAYPELDHNDIVGWGEDGEPGPFALVVLRDADLDDRTARRVDITVETTAAAFAARHEIVASPGPVLARTMALVQYGDALSWHLARVRGVDPVPVERIQELKRRLDP
ncbi:MAG: bifunctional phosphoglucose/phosphomannose isomerase [bacterium]|nr:bifunctional phosphoglucose/phosphomannose isomerase [bacterium]